MMKKILSLFVPLALFSSLVLGKIQERMVKSGDVQIWTESFGAPENPAILLVVGANSQAIMWTEKFCQKLASQGFFVIRYDHRDTGKSTAIEYGKNPYTVMDLTQDAIAILDDYNIQKAHIVGFSMGGQIGQFLGAYFPQRVASLTLMATSTSFREGFEAFEGIYGGNGLSAPIQEFVKWATQPRLEKQSYSDKVKNFLTMWELCNNNQSTFDRKLYQELAKSSFERSRIENPYPNQTQAMKASYKAHEEAPSKIVAPTLIIHGTQDPIFGIDHGISLQNNIQNSKLELVEGMGHAMVPCFYNKIIKLISNHAINKSST